MSKPALPAVDDDGPVLGAVERDLRERYAEHYQVLAGSSGEEALDVLRRSARAPALGLATLWRSSTSGTRAGSRSPPPTG